MTIIRCVAISDIHMIFEEPRFLPDGDLFVLSGDLTNHGLTSELNEVAEWFARIVNKYELGIVVIAGNHDMALQNTVKKNEWVSKLRGISPKIYYLEHESITLGGLEIFGSPYVPTYCNMAFNRTADERKKLWAAIPKTVRLLITHSPPSGILDGVPGPASFFKAREIVSAGCEYLRERLSDLPNLKVHVFGHIHWHGGQSMEIPRENGDGSILFVNAAMGYDEGRQGQVGAVEFEIEV